MQTVTEQFLSELINEDKFKETDDVDKTKDLMKQLDKITTPEKMSNTGGGTPVL